MKNKKSAVVMVEYIVSQNWNMSSCVVSGWMELVKPDLALLRRAACELPATTGSYLVNKNISLELYLFSYEELLQPLENISQCYIKNLPEEIYHAHLCNLARSDAIANCEKSLAFPYCSFVAEAFVILRHVSLKKDVKFAYEIFTRKQSHHTFMSARQKFELMAYFYESDLKNKKDKNKARLMGQLGFEVKDSVKV